MRVTRTAIVAGTVALLVAGTAALAAEKVHQLRVALPDGSVARVEYVGDVAPKVMVQPVQASAALSDPFAEFDHIAALLDAQQQSMMEQVTKIQQAAMQGNAGAVPASLPAGVHYSYVSTATDARGCTQTVQYSSDGSGQAPKVTRASAGNCDSVKAAGPVAASAAEAPAGTSGQRV